MASSILSDLVSNPDICDELLNDLDHVAQQHGKFEYGLPLHDESLRAHMRETIYRWAAQAEENF